LGSGAGPFPGGFSIYGGAGGFSGGGLSASNGRGASATPTATGALGSGGIQGFAGYYEINSATTRVGYGDGKFLMTSTINSNLVYTSTNGTTWTKTPIPSVNAVVASLLALIHDGTQWIAADGSNLYTLQNDFSDGWILKANTNSGFRSIAHFAGTYVAVGFSGAIRTSTDLVNWTLQTSGTTQTLQDVIHDGTWWLITGNGGEFLRSTDAINWTRTTTLTQGGVRIASNGSGTLVVLTGETPFARRSTDNGNTWTNVGSTLTNNIQAISGIIFDGSSGRFIAVNGTNIYNSLGGTTWSTNNSGVFSGLAFGGGTFVAGDSTETTTTIAYSSTSPTAAFTARTGPSYIAAGQSGGNGGIACGGGGGGGSPNGFNSGAGGSGGDGLIRVYTW
jgi:hypothetical protein